MLLAQAHLRPQDDMVFSELDGIGSFFPKLLDTLFHARLNNKVTPPS
jgi:hypothetical protein